MNKVLIIGEPILDITIPVVIAEQSGSGHGRGESLIYEQQDKERLSLGGVFYWARFLHNFPEITLKVVFPKPNGGFRIKAANHLIEIEKTRLAIESIPVVRRFAEILRLVETRIEKFHNPSILPRSILRVDSGDRHRIRGSEFNNIWEIFEKIYKEWFIKEEVSKRILVLADYNLGLFTRALLEKINDLVRRGIDIIVYARRSWQKYGDCFKKGNCTIVADMKGTIAELSESEDKLHDEKQIFKNPIGCIKARFPKLRQVVLVDRSKTLFARWNDDPKFLQLNTEYKGLFTPTGHRAIIGACLCIDNFIDLPAEYLPKAHYAAANYCGPILISNISPHYAEDILSYKLDDKKPKPIVFSSTPSDTDEFLCCLCDKGLKLDLRKAKTGLDEVYTIDPELEKIISNLLTGVDENQAPGREQLTLVDSSPIKYAQKILIYGSPGAGKTFIAEAMAKQEFSIDNIEDVKLQCNDLVGEAGSFATQIMNFIIACKDKNIAILDEINNLPASGAAVQKSLAAKLYHRPPYGTMVKDRMILIAVGSLLTIDDMKIETQNNLPDFYERFVAKYQVPDLSKRQLDCLYTSCIKLYQKDIRMVSLKGVIAIKEKYFYTTRKLNEFIEKMISKLPTGENSLDDRWFTDNEEELGLTIKENIEADRFVTLLFTET